MNADRKWDSWLPTAENINALPHPLRSYIHQLERCDPSGDTQELVIARETCRVLDIRLAGALSATRKLTVVAVAATMMAAFLALGRRRRSPMDSSKAKASGGRLVCPNCKQPAGVILEPAARQDRLKMLCGACGHCWPARAPGMPKRDEHDH